MQDLIIYFGVGIASAGTVVGLIAFCLHRKKKKKVAGKQALVGELKRQKKTSCLLFKWLLILQKRL